MMSEDYRQHHSKHRPRDERTTRPLFAARTHLLHRSSGDYARKTHSNSRRMQTPGLPKNPDSRTPDSRATWDWGSRREEVVQALTQATGGSDDVQG